MDKALYQSHRPSSFDDMFGQDIAVRLLKNAIESNSIAHAYLFSGSRGTGKTSIARIFANELKIHPVDVFEIDAASYTSVEDIRTLNKDVYTLPARSKYKLYILDEVHMLSKSAFNAFLKTLEEPPSHIIFILATTEPEKLPETIISRCITLKFVSPTIKHIKEVVKRVSDLEKRELEDSTLLLISIMADGSYRDALSVLQKLLTISKDKKITDKDARLILGVPETTLVNNYITALLQKDIKSGVGALDIISNSNVDMKFFGKLVARKLRSALLLKGGVDIQLADDFDEIDIKYIQDLSKNNSLTVDVLKNVLEIMDMIETSFIKQLPFEYLLLK